uniref:Secreted protein n=1 Tax=Knipowitschia caucasica TaxID=637954 RepID=A0AAV2JY38_KNICA
MTQSLNLSLFSVGAQWGLSGGVHVRCCVLPPVPVETGSWCRGAGDGPLSLPCPSSSSRRSSAPQRRADVGLPWTLCAPLCCRPHRAQIGPPRTPRGAEKTLRLFYKSPLTPL